LVNRSSFWIYFRISIS